VSARYVIRPKADQDLEDQAHYLATRGSADLGHRFLIAAHEAFVLLASQPNIGWHARLKDPELKPLRIFSISGFEKMLVFYRPHSRGNRNCPGCAWFAKLAFATHTARDGVVCRPHTDDEGPLRFIIHRFTLSLRS